MSNPVQDAIKQFMSTKEPPCKDCSHFRPTIEMKDGNPDTTLCQSKEMKHDFSCHQPKKPVSKIPKNINQIVEELGSTKIEQPDLPPISGSAVDMVATFKNYPTRNLVVCGKEAYKVFCLHPHTKPAATVPLLPKSITISDIPGEPRWTWYIYPSEKMKGNFYVLSDMDMPFSTKVTGSVEKVSK